MSQQVETVPAQEEKEKTPAVATAGASPSQKEEKTPELPPLVEVAAPDEAAFNEFRANFDQQMRAIRDKVAAIHRDARQKEIEKQHALQEVNRVYSFLQHMDQELQTKSKEIEPLEQERLSLERTLKREQDELAHMRDRLDFVDDEALEKAIQEKQRYMETNSLPVAEERKIVKEISRLHSSRALIAPYRAKLVLVQRAQDAYREAENKTRERSRDIERLTERVKRQKAQWESIKGKESHLDKEINSMRNEDLEKLTAQSKTLCDDLNRRREELRRQTEAYETYKRELAHRQWLAEQEKKKKQEEARRKAMEERRKEQERLWKEKQEEFEYVPYVEEMTLCDTLAAYLERLIAQPAPVEASPTPQASEKKELPQDLLSEDGRQLVLKKDEDEVFFQGGKGKKKRAPRQEAPRQPKQTAVLVHSRDVFTGFTSLSLDPPMTLEEVPASIAALKAKKEYYKTAPPPEQAPKQPRGPRRAPAPATATTTSPTPAAQQPPRPAPRNPRSFRAADVDWTPLKAPVATPAEGAAPVATETAPVAPKANTVWAKFSATHQPPNPSAQPPLRSAKVTF
eukprot:GAFH01001141.1.p1 GENE.GAFH01001141.1~~GAFH01001141.1.p1  ORF type:complete len:570 (-),score=125.29 GAFH01001141.1:203-1912(-)